MRDFLQAIRDYKDESFYLALFIIICLSYIVGAISTIFKNSKKVDP